MIHSASARVIGEAAFIPYSIRGRSLVFFTSVNEYRDFEKLQTYAVFKTACSYSLIIVALIVNMEGHQLKAFYRFYRLSNGT